MKPHSVHVHSMRIATGEEVLVARVIAPDGRVGYGFSFRVDATEARHMAEWAAGVRAERPACCIYSPSSVKQSAQLTFSAYFQSSNRAKSTACSSARRICDSNFTR